MLEALFGRFKPKENPKPIIKGQVCRIHSRELGTTRWINMWQVGSKVVYEGKVVGGPHGENGPSTMFDPQTEDPNSSHQELLAEEFHAIAMYPDLVENKA